MCRAFNTDSLLNALMTTIVRRNRQINSLPGRRAIRAIALAVLAVATACGQVLSQNIANHAVSRVPQARVGAPPEGIENCNKPDNPNHILPAGTKTTDLQISGINCVVDGSAINGEKGTYVYRNVNIYNGGTLTFQDKQIDFHAHSILVEMGGTLRTSGSINGPLTIWLWGRAGDGIDSITCKSDAKNQCGIPDKIWGSNPNLPMKKMPMETESCKTVSSIDAKYKGIPSSVDCFYQYDKLDAGDRLGGAYFGRKVLAVSAGGNLMLQGAKGVRIGEPIEAASGDSGTSWVRLVTTLKGDRSTADKKIYIDRAVPTWSHGDHIVVTTTDYLPGHTEEFVIDKVTTDSTGHTWIDIDSSESVPESMRTVQFPHWGEAYSYEDIAAVHDDAGPGPDPGSTVNRSTLPPNHIETRAIVALLTRSIKIASEGDPLTTRATDHFPVGAGFYGGHTIVRQGFNTYQVQGVEFYQLGQGGMIGRYPVHFHMDRTVPQPVLAASQDTPAFLGTYVADSSIVDSMTRFITVHATQGVTLARNVGYKSIGHGFYLEDATEINNRLYSNVGISVRGALDDKFTNPRKVPGILDLPVGALNTIRNARVKKGDPLPPQLAAGSQIPDEPPFVTDVTTPSVFWIMNTWNDFQYNVAVGAGACGACYWMPPGAIGGPSRYETWTGYASMENLKKGLAGATPVLNFTGNSCTAAMAAIVTVGATNQCNGVKFGEGSSTDTQLVSVVNPNSAAVDQYPAEDQGQRAKTTVCDAAHQRDCSTVPPCTGSGPSEKNCGAFVIDRFTTSFNWAPTNFAAVWLRGWWFLMDNSAITDVQNAGITFISGGGYSRSDAAQGYWSVLKNSILVGNTQPIDSATGLPANPFASNAGPFNPAGLKCPYNTEFCLSLEQGIVFVNSNFAVNQRLFNIYDGPSSEYNNIYSDIHPTDLGSLSDCRGINGGVKVPGNCTSLGYMNGYVPGVLQVPPGLSFGHCFLPNAAIAWKQPNGFYYPPSFNSDNLVFDNVDIRHFVIQPLYKPNSFLEDTDAITKTYCTWNPGMFKDSYTDIDRQTELTDNDGSLTGLTSNTKTNTPQEGPTISVTKDPFYNAPLTTDECASGQPSIPTSNKGGATVDTSPYDYLTTAIVAECARPGADPNCYAAWKDNSCTTPACYGVPLYRQSLTQDEMTAYHLNRSNRPSIRMMGQASAQRSTMTVNHVSYYIDTTVPTVKQQAAGPFLNVFQPGKAYDIFFLYATNTTKQSYRLHIGPKLSTADAMATITPGRMPVPDNSFKFDTTKTGTWATYGGYDSGSGMLTVNVDLSKATDLSPSSRKDYCQPITACAWNSTKNTCGCKKVNGKCVNQNVDDKVCSFATKDVDCPVDGCYGFRITLPDTFEIEPNKIEPVPPAPGLYTDDTYFQKPNVTFVSATQDVAGNCFYQTTPAQNSTRDLLTPSSERLDPGEAPNH
jgi:hypothetical protein